MESLGKQKRKRSCWAIAKAQVRRPDQGRAVLQWLPLVLFGVLMAGATGRPNPIVRRVLPVPADQPRSQYEGGRPVRSGRHQERYKVRPTMHRLVRDLRRPVARKEARDLLLGRIVEMDLREWVAQRIDLDEISRLAICARPGASDDVVIEAWRMELDRDRRVATLEAEAERVQARVARAVGTLLGPDSISRSGKFG